MHAIAAAPEPAESAAPSTPSPGPGHGPAPRRALGAAVLALLAYTALALALFPNVVAHLTNAFPGDLGDPPSQAWILAWDLHGLATNPAHLYDGNIFYPFHDVLAYQDSLLGLLPLAAPILALTGNAVLTYNVLFLLSFALCAWGAYLLARLLVGDSRAAFLAGLVYGFSAYRMVHLYHLNLLGGFWLPFALLCWERAWRGERRYWLGLGLCTVLQALTALYYAAFLTVALAILLVLRLRRPHPHPPSRVLGEGSLGRGAAAPPRHLRERGLGGESRFALLTALGCGVVLLPFFLPYFRVEHALGASRGLSQAVYFSADLRDFLHSVDLSVLYGWTGHALGVRSGDALQFLWPGLVALALALYGLLRRPGRRDPGQRHYAVLGLIAAVFCLGPFLKLGGHQTGLPLPYLLLYPLPGFAGLRDPARFGAIYTLCLAVLAAYGASALLSLARSTQRRGWSRLAAIALCVGVLAEAWLRPLPVVAVPVGAAVPPVYRWLAAHPGGAVLELPIGLQNKTIWAQQAQMMYFSTYHWHPIVNGTGGFAPPGYNRDVPLYNSFPVLATLRLLRARHVAYVLVHRDWLGAASASTIRARARHAPGVRLIAHWSGADLYAVR